MNKSTEEIREALKPHRVEGFTAFCNPVPALEQVTQLLDEVERLTAESRRKDFTIATQKEVIQADERLASHLVGEIDALLDEVERLMAANETLHSHFKDECGECDVVAERDKYKSAMEVAKAGIGRMRKADPRPYIGPEYQAIMDEIHAAGPGTCQWSRNPEIGQFHDTECGVEFEYDQDMNFCPACGKRLALAESV